MIRFPGGAVCNLTREAGFGVDGLQGPGSIAVRDPSVHYSGEKALFSMVVGGPGRQYEVNTYFWQIYEVSGLELGTSVTITKVPGQPEDYNNVGAIYGSDGRIIFSSDRPRNGQRHLWPQHDEYESSPTPTGLWSLNPGTGDLFMLQHSPSGSFDPIVDAFGRIIYSRWDHLMRDQQASADDAGSSRDFGTFDYADESAEAAKTTNRVEVFPEPLPSYVPPGSNEIGIRINHFFPWEINQDGTVEETLNHLGRHEMHEFFTRTFDDDDNLIDFTSVISGRTNSNPSFNFFQIAEDPTSPGRFLMIDAPEFNTHASGQIIAFQANPELNPDDVVIEYVTHPDTVGTTGDGQVPPPTHSGHYRDPLPLANGGLLASHTYETRGIENEGTRANPISRYDFRLRTLVSAPGGYLVSASELTSGIDKTLSYYDPDVLVSYSGPMWELHAVEVKSTPTPPLTSAPPLHESESLALAQAAVDEGALRQFLRDSGLAMVVVRDATSRDDMDRQQPYNLAVPGGVSAVGSSGRVYDIQYMQFFQGDQVRGIGGIDTPDSGRRVLARHLHDPMASTFNPDSAYPGSGLIAADGSVAMFVPARRALAWQSISPSGDPVVRERLWVTFQPGEIRVCDGCHGVNKVNQVGAPASENLPAAMVQLLNHWKSRAQIFSDSFGN